MDFEALGLSAPFFANRGKRRSDNGGRRLLSQLP